MSLTGEMLIGGEAVRGGESEIHGIDPATGEWLEPAFGGGGEAEVEQACALAAEAFPIYRETTLEARATFLETIATRIDALGDMLTDRAMRETGLPRARLEGERGRTVGQLRLFAKVVRDGTFIGARIDPALPDRTPLPRVDLRLRRIAVGPVAVFGASNFPLAFSVGGGDTASALASGCPVVVKAHSAHPGTSALVGGAIAAAVAECGMPRGTFSLLFGNGSDIGSALVRDPRIKAGGFTGSRGGGTALMALAAARPQPIPVYAEMSSINPVLLFPEALKARGDAIGTAFAGSLTLGVGQFCTNPGLVIAIGEEGLDSFVTAASQAIGGGAAATMLTPGIHAAYDRGVATLGEVDGVERLARGLAATGPNAAQASFFATDAVTFLADRRLHEEVFGPSSLLVRCADAGEARAVVATLEGQLTIALHIDAGDHDAAAKLLPLLEEKAGRLLVNGFGTGVEVSPAMVHGGPYPATSDGRTTSVGTLAIDRFLRPVCYQDMPAALLPAALADGNPLGLWRSRDGAPGID